MNIAPTVLHHNERYGDLTVLRKEGAKYRVGCVCGNSNELYRAKALMRADGPRKCRKCRKQIASMHDHDHQETT